MSTEKQKSYSHLNVFEIGRYLMRVKRSYSDGGEEYNSAVVTVYTYTIVALYRRYQFIFHLSYLPWY